MQIPDKVKIGGLTFTIKYEDKLASGEDAFGKCRFLAQEIVLEGGLSEEHKGETLLHEIIEAINGNYGFKMEHQLITSFCYALHQVLRDNKLHFDE